MASYWICRAAWRRAGRPRSGGGCRPRGHSGRKARPERRDLPGTPLPLCFQTPGAKRHGGISPPLAASHPTAEIVGDNGSPVRSFECIEARPPSYIHKSCTLWGVLCGSGQRRCGEEPVNACVCVCAYTKTFFLPHTLTRQGPYQEKNTETVVKDINF